MRVFRAAVAITLLATGCATPTPTPPSSSPSSSPSSPSPSASASASQAQAVAVTVKKTGGIAGVSETLTIDATGGWTRTTRTGTRSGKLTGDQLSRLRSLATDPRLATEAIQVKSPGNCADAFEYVVTVQSLAIRYSDCGSPGGAPATSALVQFLEQATT